MLPDHSEMFPLTGLVSLSAILSITWEGPSGCSIGVARCSSVSHLSSDSAWGCSIPVKKAQVASPLEWTLDNSPPVLQAGWQLPLVKRCLVAHPMRAEDIPLKRHFDTCRGIATYIVNPFTTPTQEAFAVELLLILSLAHSTSHSRGILIHTVELLLALSLAHSMPHSRGNTVSYVDALLIFTLVVTVNYSGNKPTLVHWRDNSVNCCEPLTLINYV